LGKSKRELKSHNRAHACENRSARSNWENQKVTKIEKSFVVGKIDVLECSRMFFSSEDPRVHPQLKPSDDPGMCRMIPGCVKGSDG
jgi:hypothetical protein